MTNPTAPEIVKPLSLSDGFFYVPEFSATGGVKYSRRDGWEDEDGERVTAEYTTRKEIQHIGMVKWSRKIINAAYVAMEKFCSVTPIGYWVTKENVDELEKALAAVKREAEAFNAGALQQGLERRVRIDVYAVKASESDDKVAVRLAQTVRERLGDLVTDLRAGDLNAYTSSWKKAKNLNRLATGIQAESIVIALEAAKEAHAALRKAINEKISPEKAGAALDLVALESAIVLFTDSVMGNLASVQDEILDLKVA